MKESSSYGHEFIEKLKNANDIVSVISKHIRLDKKGKNFWACCPFHNENAPSFCVNEYEQIYHCFGCGESGDVITFLRKYENLDFMDAVKVLADSAGMKLPKLKDDDQYLKTKKMKDRSLNILNLAKEFYKANLYKKEAKLAQDYIKNRSLSKNELDNFELGASLNYYDIVNKLKEKGFSDKELKESGVCEIGKNGKAYDFLSERLIFPIINAQNDCIGFSGRDLKNSGTMKYKNTSATLLFDKSKVVYGINLIKKHKQESQKLALNYIILVEGQFDVISMHKSGFKNTVACLGTAITKDHIRDLKRFTNAIVLCLDGDEAGQKATIRAIENLNSSDLTIKVVRLPDNLDPDDFIKKYGAKELQKLIDEAISPIQFRILFAKRKFSLNKADEKAKFIKDALKIIAELESQAEQEIYLKELKDITGISIDILRRDLRAEKKPLNFKEEKSVEEVPELDAKTRACQYIMASKLHHKDFARLPQNFISHINNPDYKKLLELIKAKEDKNEKFFMSSIFDEFDVENNKNIKALINFNFEIIENPQQYFNQCLWLIIENYLKFKKSLLSKQYSNERDAEKKTDILKEISIIDNKLKNKNLEEL
ncbi:MAG: DNA primase [Clostridia bacterium]|nr:DNA primase [Clostridia bacterium]MDD4686195.1 DNA primase [Clostridia bacterium]